MKATYPVRALASVFAGLLLTSSPQGCVRNAVRNPAGVQAPREEPPPGFVEVHAVSDYADRTWDVYARGNVVCTTPCTQWFREGEPLFLESQDGDSVVVHDLGDDTYRARRAVLVAEGTCRGKQVNGIVFTTLGGMGIVVATTLTAIGCSNV